MKFDKFPISSEIKANLEHMGFIRTTDIQFKTIPAIMKGEDVLAIAQTGTGKTAAFAIPIINQIHEEKRSSRSAGIRCLVMVPTRELAKQIGQVFAKLTKNTKAKCFAVYGGVDEKPQILQLEGGVDILIATPGRMFDLIRQHFIDVRRVNILVLDEADHMLDLGFIEDIKAIKAKLNRKHQTLFFSATINPTIKKLAYSQVNSSALRIQVSPENLVSKNVTHCIVRVGMDDKRHLLVNFLIENPDIKALIFVRTQVRAERVLAHLTKRGFNALNIHGGMVQADREKNLEAFRGQPSGLMIATDVSARGIDLPGITHVINYDIPDDPENYVHRVGRTGRAFNKGDAVSFCGPEEAEKLTAIEELIQTKVVEMKVDKLHFQESLKDAADNINIATLIEDEEARLYGAPPKLKINSKDKLKKKGRK